MKGFSIRKIASKTAQLTTVLICAMLVLAVAPHSAVPAKREAYLWFEVQHADTNCFPEKLVKILKKVADHFEKPVVVHSGFRTKRYNRRVGGTKNSLHTRCKAADFFVPGVSGKKLYEFVRHIPERGGAGYYCGNSIHVDVGRKRCWGPCGECQKEPKIQKQLQRQLASIDKQKEEQEELVSHKL